jgi:cell shape-determining protein MreC
VAWQRIWQSGIPSLAIAAACGLGLLVAPEPATSRVRATLRDSLIPGCRVVDGCESGWQSAWTWTATGVRGWLLEATNPEIAVAENPAASDADAQRELRALVADLAAARQHVAELERDQRLRITVPNGAQSLLSAEFVMARVIASDRDSQQALSAQLIDAGTAAGLAADDLVIEPLSGDVPEETRETLVVDRGTRDAIASDAPVIRGGALIGRVVAPGLLTSTVQRVSDPEFRTGAQIVRVTEDGPVFGAAGVFAGTGRGTGRLELIPITAPVSQGDRVYAAGPDSLDEHWFYIGDVAKAEVVDGEPHWRITVHTDARDPPRDVAVLKTKVNEMRLSELASDDATTN